MRTGRLKQAVLRGLSGLIGAERTHRLVMQRNFAAYRREGVIFVHVPKAAGSTISEALYGRSLGHKTAAEMQSYDAEWFARLPSFAVMRDPVERAYSAWAYARAGGTAEGWVEPRADYALPGFSDFDRFAAEWLPPRIGDPDLDFVFRPQSHFVSGEGVLVDRLFRLGDWDPLSDWLETAIGRGLTQTRWRNQNPAAVPAEIPVETRTRLTDLYAADMALFADIP